MCQWLMAKFYDKIMRDAEDKCLRDWRGLLLHELSGEVLELGCGTGANLEFYPDTVKRLILLEPSTHMQLKLKRKVLDSGLSNIELLTDKAENISLPDSSVDAVVCTLVLCTVTDLEKTLAEIYRILRPQGRLVFIEHVAATDNPKRFQWQRRLEFLWKFIAAGCHVTRKTEDAIRKAGFTITEINHQSMRGVPAIVRPSIRGIAVKN